MPLRYFIVPFILGFLWLGLLLLENYFYYKNQSKMEIRYKKTKEAKKKNFKEFKWPDWLPHHDLYL